MKGIFGITCISAMKLYRRTADLPIAYSLMPWIRNEGRLHFVDCDDPGEMRAIDTLKLIVRGDLDASSFDTAYEFILALQIPCEIKACNGTSGRSIFVESYKWHVADPVFLVDDEMQATYADIAVAGFTASELFHLANSKHSAVDYIEGLEKYAGYKKGHYCGSQAKQKLRDLEKRNMALIKMARKRSTLYVSSRTTRTQADSISQKMRNEVLQDHEYTCLFCGKGRPNVLVEAHHVIPKNIVMKLRLDMNLLSCRWNLVAACKGCNGAKSDTLAPEDLRFITSHIASGHLEKNRRLMPFLEQFAGFSKGL